MMQYWKRSAINIYIYNEDLVYEYVHTLAHVYVGLFKL